MQNNCAMRGKQRAVTLLNGGGVGGVTDDGKLSRALARKVGGKLMRSGSLIFRW